MMSYGPGYTNPYNLGMGDVNDMAPILMDAGSATVTTVKAKGSSAPAWLLPVLGLLVGYVVFFRRKAR